MLSMPGGSEQAGYAVQGAQPARRQSWEEACEVSILAGSAPTPGFVLLLLEDHWVTNPSL